MLSSLFRTHGTWTSYHWRAPILRLVIDYFDFQGHSICYRLTGVYILYSLLLVNWPFGKVEWTHQTTLLITVKLFQGTQLTYRTPSPIALLLVHIACPVSVLWMCSTGTPLLFIFLHVFFGGPFGSVWLSSSSYIFVVLWFFFVSFGFHFFFRDRKHKAMWIGRWGGENISKYIV